LGRGRALYRGVVPLGYGLVGLVGEVVPPGELPPIGVPIGPEPILLPEPPEAGPPRSAAFAFICSIRGSYKNSHVS